LARGLAEETPEAYKDITQVVEAAEGAGLCRKVARLIPLGVIKGLHDRHLAATRRP